MKGALSIVVTTILLLAVPTGVAPPSANGQENSSGNSSNDGSNSGLERACDVSRSPQPCAHIGFVTDFQVNTGENDSYNGTWTVDETIVVETGGTLVLEDATFRFTAESGGILVQPGGVVRIFRSTLEPREGDASAYTLDLAQGSSFTLNDSTIRAGQGVKLKTNDADVSGNLLTEIPLALHMIDVVEVNIHHNHFLNNTVSVNQTGGITTLDSNFFEGGDTCVRDWLADPTITNNIFRRCHTGIWHERSNSVFSLNDMEDDAHEPGVGIAVVDTNSPIIEDNVIRNYGTGILVRNATAYIRNNSITNNVGDGVRIQDNSQVMDIAGNVIASNGGDGIHLLRAQGVTLSGNTIQANLGSGVRVEDSLRVELVGDSVSDSGEHGLALSSSNVDATDVSATGNTLSGFFFGGTGSYEMLRANASANGQDGFHVAAPTTTVDLAEPTAIANGANGLTGRTGTTANFGWWEANGGAGVENADADHMLPAECSYWGDSSGPTHVDNPGGTGDEVIGNVDYSPFRPSPATTSCAPPVLIAGDGYVE